MSISSHSHFSVAALSSACAAVLLAACGGASTEPIESAMSAEAESGVVMPESTVVTSWTRCATEYGTCTVSGTREVRYGLGTRWATRTVTGSVACNNSVFGDPYPGANKVCEYATTSTAPEPAPVPEPVPTPPAPTTTWTRCATEYGTCNFTGTTQVRYGLDTRWATRTATGSIACNNTTFGDPYPGASKVCDYATTTQAPAPAPAPTSWTRCASEYGTCTFTGTRTVRYGYGDRWATRTATGSIACNNTVFGDPFPGANKVCDYGNTTTTTPTPPATTTPTPTPPATTTPTPTPTPTWTRCASEYGTCTFTGTRTVRYGLGERWATRTATGSIACNNTVFGDPYPGANKVCEYENTTTTTPTPTPTPPATTTPTPTPTPPATSTTVSPYGQDASAYTLNFADEFNGGFNTSVWNDHIWYEGSNATKNYTVEDGKLKIWPQRDASGKFFNRTLDTDGKFYQTYGYFEIEAKLPVGKGTWPAFWLFNHIGDRRPEMDVMEAYAGGAAPWGFNDANGIAHPQAYAPTVWNGPNTLVGTRQYDTGMDLSAGFHKYAVKWEPTKQTYYFDGKVVLTLNTTFSDPMYLMLDLWFGSASGTPDNSTPQGKANSYEVNYIRAWKFK